MSVQYENATPIPFSGLIDLSASIPHIELLDGEDGTGRDGLAFINSSYIAFPISYSLYIYGYAIKYIRLGTSGNVQFMDSSHTEIASLYSNLDNDLQYQVYYKNTSTYTIFKCISPSYGAVTDVFICSEGIQVFNSDVSITNSKMGYARVDKGRYLDPNYIDNGVNFNGLKGYSYTLLTKSSGVMTPDCGLSEATIKVYCSKPQAYASTYNVCGIKVSPVITASMTETEAINVLVQAIQNSGEVSEITFNSTTKMLYMKFKSTVGKHCSAYTETYTITTDSDGDEHWYDSGIDFTTEIYDFYSEEERCKYVLTGACFSTYSNQNFTGATKYITNKGKKFFYANTAQERDYHFVIPLYDKGVLTADNKLNINVDGNTLQPYCPTTAPDGKLQHKVAFYDGSNTRYLQPKYKTGGNSDYYSKAIKLDQLSNQYNESTYNWNTYPWQFIDENGNNITISTPFSFRLYSMYLKDNPTYFAGKTIGIYQWTGSRIGSLLTTVTFPSNFNSDFIEMPIYVPNSVACKGFAITPRFSANITYYCSMYSNGHIYMLPNAKIVN